MGRQMAKKYGIEKSLLPLLDHGQVSSTVPMTPKRHLMIHTPPPTPQKITTSDLTIVKKSRAFTSLEGLFCRLPIDVPTMNINERQEAILKIIFLEGNETELLHLLRKGQTLDFDFPLDQEKNTALHWAASLGRLHLVQVLVCHGANLNCQNAKGETPLQRLLGYECSFQNGTFEDLLTLFESCLFYQNDQKQSILHTLAIHPHASTGHYLKAILSRTQDLEHEFFVNGQDDAGDTPLHLAYRYDHDSAIQILYDFGARDDIYNQAGRYPSESASFSMFDSGFFTLPELKKEDVPKATLNGNDMVSIDHDRFN
jgi:ankyrin repeat protein